MFRRLKSPKSPVNIQHQEQLKPLDRAALVITTRVGTMSFFLVIFGWTAVWLLWNVFAPVSLRFDPAPAFVFWLFISNMIQIFLMPLVMVGQNLQGAHSELRAEYDHQTVTDMKAQLATILAKLEAFPEVSGDKAPKA
ncbi:MAG: DUF1003 domain-containing protein [Sulfobacillus sp.]